MTNIKKIIIDNFQSHEHTEIEFGPGLNVIVGPSDYGKSAVVRALRWVLYNEPRGSSFIRAGAKVCKATIELNDGTLITRLRSTTGKNQYLLRKPDGEELVFEGFGNEIPAEIIQASGVRKVIIDENNKVELNFGAQLEGPFLLAENGAVRAKVIGQLGGVHIIDLAQRSVNTDLRRLAEQEKRCQEELQQITEALTAYEHLPELEKRIEKIEGLLQRIENTSQMIEKLTSLQSEWEENKAALDKNQELLAAITGLDGAEAEYGELKNVFDEYKTLISLDMEIKEVNLQLKRCLRVIAETAQVPVADDYLKKADPLFQEWKELSRVQVDLENIDRAIKKIVYITERTKELEKVKNNLEEAEKKWSRLADYRKIRQEWLELEKAYQGACLAAERYQKEINENLEKFRKFLLKIGRCPVCYGELDQEAVERVLDEYR
ncbi:MAG TPA: AAA family ATPase [Syntrophaceticus sp.]|nr:AAA family ATPase [Syntrophaceticus sp.]